MNKISRKSIIEGVNKKKSITADASSIPESLFRFVFIISKWRDDQGEEELNRTQTKPLLLLQRTHCHHTENDHRKSQNRDY